MRRFLDALPHERRLFFELLAHTGLRIGEAIALSGVTSTPAAGACTSAAASTAAAATSPRPATAGARSRSPRASPESSRAEEQMKKVPVFPTKGGGHLDPANLSKRVLKPTATAAGIPWAGFHTVRHTCATLLFRHGLNAKQVQVWLGHHSPAFTLATYFHPLAHDLPDASFLDEITALRWQQSGNSPFRRRDEDRVVRVEATQAVGSEASKDSTRACSAARNVAMSNEERGTVLGWSL